MRWMLFGLPWLALGCWGQGEEPPGEAVGTFNAVGLMVEQSCGEVIPAPDPLDLDFELRSESNGRAYWRRIGGSMFAGVENDGEFTFQVSESWMVIQPDRFRSYVGCSVTQRDVFTFKVEGLEVGADAGVEDAGASDGGSEVDAATEPKLLTLTGSQTTAIEPIAGSDCTPAVAALGGPFLSLPCRVEYVLTGTGVGVDQPEP
jgi:hypothetical protein